MPTLRSLIALPALLALALPASAQAATLGPLKPCYVSVNEATREPVPVEAGGFTPGSKVDVAIDGTPVKTDVPVLLDGTISGSVSSPYQARGQRPFMISVTEQGRPENTVSAPSKVTALSLRVRPKKAPPRKRVRFSGRGFTTGEPIYGHYVFGGHPAQDRELRDPARGLRRVQRQAPPDPDPQAAHGPLDAAGRHRAGVQP